MWLFSGARVGHKPSSSVKEKGSKRGRRPSKALRPSPPSGRGNEKGHDYQGRFRWRDPDSNRGHHDFQSCTFAAENCEIPGSQAVPARASRPTNVRSLQTFVANCGNGRRLRPKLGLAAESSTSGPCLRLAVDRNGAVGRVGGTLVPPGRRHDLGAGGDDCVSSKAVVSSSTIDTVASAAKQRSPAARAPRTRHRWRAPAACGVSLHMDVRRLRPIKRPRCRRAAHTAVSCGACAVEHAAPARGQDRGEREIAVASPRARTVRRIGDGRGGERFADRARGRDRGQLVLIQVRPQTNLSPGSPPTSLKRRRLPLSFQRAVMSGPPVPSNLMTSLKIE